MRVSDNGTELTSNAIPTWGQRTKLTGTTSSPGKRNAFAESFIGRLRDGCLNETLFTSLGGRAPCWPLGPADYNEIRPYAQRPGQRNSLDRPRNTITMGAEVTPDSTSEWRGVWAQVTGCSQLGRYSKAIGQRMRPANCTSTLSGARAGPFWPALACSCPVSADR